MAEQNFLAPGPTKAEFDTLNGTVSGLADQIANMQLVPVNITLNISANSSIDVDLSSYIPSGRTLNAISHARLAQYSLPYVESGVVKTYISNINATGKKITIVNNASAWTSYGFMCVLFLV